MKHLFVPYKIAALAKEKGFNEPCLALIEIESREILHEYVKYKSRIAKGWIKLPLYQQIIDWFREEHKIYISIDLISGYWFFSIFRVLEAIGDSMQEMESNDYEPTYYEALNKAIEEAFTLI